MASGGAEDVAEALVSVATLDAGSATTAGGGAAATIGGGEELRLMNIITTSGDSDGDAHDSACYPEDGAGATRDGRR